MYNIGDMVLYGGEGLCRISAIEERKIADKKISYYMLSPAKESSAVFYVPVEGKTASTKLREIISADEFILIVESAKPAEWIENDRARRDRYKTAINEADRVSLASYVKAIKIHKEELISQGKKLHKLDEYFYTEVEDLLFGELKTIFRIERTEIIPFILGEASPEKL